MLPVRAGVGSALVKRLKLWLDSVWHGPQRNVRHSRFERLRLEPLECRRMLAMLYIPTDLTGNPGDIVHVPVKIDVTESSGIDVLSADFALSFDAPRFTASNASISSALLPGMTATPKIDNTNGTIVVSAFKTSAVHLNHAVDDTALTVDLLIKSTTVGGDNAINLRQSVTTTSGKATTAINEGGVSLSPAPTDESDDSSVDGLLTVLPPKVLSLTPTATGFVAQFDRPVDTAALNIVDQNNVLGATDITLVGASVGTVKGTAVFDATGSKLTFIRAGGTSQSFGTLAPDTYTVTFRSASNGFKDLGGTSLDGNANGTSGDNYVSTFSVATAPSNTVKVGIDDFIRGYGQAVNVPATASTGVPIWISTGVGVTSASFTLNYNPALLDISAFTLNSGLGATSSFTISTPGTALLTVGKATELSGTAGTITLGNLTASVPDTAPYAAKEILDITNLTVMDNSGTPVALPVLDDDALHVAAYRGDLNGDRTIAVGDATQALRFQSGILSTTGFTAFQLANPNFMTDMNDDGTSTTGDITGLLRFLSGAAGGFPKIPALPTGLTPPAAGGPDPQIYIPTVGLSGAAGETVSVPVKLYVSESSGVDFAGVTASFTYDASRFTAADAQLGGALAGLGFSSSFNFDTPGLVRMIAASDMGPHFDYAYTGDLFTVSLVVKTGAAEGASALNLLADASAIDNTTAYLTLSPANTDGADSNDGSVTVNHTNVAPVNALPSTPTILEDTATAISGISISDSDAGSATVSMSLNSTNGTATIGTTGLTLSGNGTAAVTASGTIANLNTALAALTFAPASNVNGTAAASIQIVTNDQGNTGAGGALLDTDTLAINITAVNDAPSFALGTNPTVNEDAGAQTVAGFASSIVAGPANESAQTVTFSITGSTNSGLFSAGPSVSPTGTLTYTPSANANGSATITLKLSDNGGTANGGVDTSAAQTFTITVNSVNDVPSFVVGSNKTVNEDAGAQTVSSWATGLSTGPSNESSQTLSFSVTGNTNSGLFAAGPSVSPTGTLTYTPAANANGSATVTLKLIDNGGTANGGVDTSSAQTFTITVNAINDAPSFTVGTDPTVNEDAGAQTVAGFASSIVAGPANESAQTVAFSITGNTNSGLFSAGPSLSPTGTLTYTPAANGNGSATVTLKLIDNGGTANGGVDTSSAQTFTITVNSVNDVPSFVVGSNQTVNEDAGAQTVSSWATGLSTGPSNESSQTLSFSVTGNTNSALFSAGPSVSPGGTLTYTPAANANGSATITLKLIDNGGTANGGVDTSDAQTFTITVNAINDAPSFTLGANPTVNEDAGGQTVTSFASSIVAGPANESAQTVAFSITGNTNSGLFSAGPSVSPTGTLTYTPAANANGSATITVQLADNGGAANGGVDTSSAQTFAITVNSVNDVPSFVVGSNKTVNEDAGAQTVSSWATGLSTGPSNESSQTLSFSVTGNTNSGLFAAGPSVSPTGTLTYTPAANANGSATITLKLIDNGGTANGGVDTSAAQTFTITVNSVNDAPTFSVPATCTVNENGGAQTVSGFATGISAGPSDESGQTLSFSVTGNSNSSLFSVAPSINSSGRLTYTPTANVYGTANITVVLSDNGGTANGGSNASSATVFSISVLQYIPGASISGGTLTISGTGGNDTFSLSFTSATAYNIVLNGATAAYDTTTVPHVVFDGGAGTDTATLTGSSSVNETATLSSLSVALGPTTGSSYSVAVSNVETNSVYGQSGDTAIHNGSTNTSEQFAGRPDLGYCYITGGGYTNYSIGFLTTYGYAGSGSQNSLLYDTTSNDSYVSLPASDYAYMVGGGYTTYAVGYDTRYGYSTAGGTDTSTMYDTSSADSYVQLAASGYSYLTGGGFTAYSTGFTNTYGYSTAGGADTASLYDTSGNQTFVGQSTYSYMTVGSSTNYVVGFPTIHAYATGGGTDTASLYDTTGNDAVDVSGAIAKITESNSIIIFADTFDTVTA